jgi:hypothetical protein
MKIFTSHSDLDRLSDDDPVKPVVRQLLEWLTAPGDFPDHPYDPEEHGYIALVEPGDADRELDDTMRVLSTGTCPTLSGKSTLTYQVGTSPESIVHLRISKNNGGGFFSDEWLALDDILDTLKKRPKGSPVLSHFLTPLLKGKSVNTSAFILAAMTHLKLIQPLPRKKRQHVLLDPMPSLDQVTRLMDTQGKSGGTTRRSTGASTKKAAVRKAAITKKAMPKRRTAKTV